MKAYSYIRWSSDPQTDGDSLARQLEVTRRICKEKGWDLDESLEPDAALSAYRGTNLAKGSLGLFLARVKSKEIATPCVLVVEALDRITRTRLRDARKLFDGLLESGVSICTAHNGKVYDETSLENPLDLIISLMELNAAYIYSASLGRRVSAAWTRKKEAAARGVLLTRRIPSWLILNKKTNKMTVNKPRAKIIRRIFEEYIKGKGVFTIAQDLNKDGIAAFEWGKGWGSTSVRRFLNSLAVIGVYQPHKYIKKGKSIPEGQPIENYYPAIVSKTQFYKAQELLKSRFTPRGPRRNVLTVFTGLVRCAKCGETMRLKAGNITTKNNKPPWLALVCSKAMRGRGCEYKTMRYQPFEKGVLTAILSQVLQHEKVDNDNGKLEELRAELQHVQKGIERANAVITGEDRVPKSLLKTLGELEKKEDSLKAQIAALPMPDGNAPTLYSEILSGRKEPMLKTIENRLRMRGILARLIERIELDAPKRTAKVFFPTFTQDRTGKMVQWSQLLSWNENAGEGVFINGNWQDYNDGMIWRERAIDI